MIEHLADIENIRMFQLILRKWQTLKELVYTLSIPERATIDLQQKKLVLSDVFAIWMKMALHLNRCNARKSYKTNLSKCLLDAFDERK